MERVELIKRLRAWAGAALVERGGAVFLLDPGWGERERAQWAALAERTPPDWDGREGWLCIATGGSSGAMKLARHDERTLGAAVAGFSAHYGVTRVDATGVLPPWHVSGLMAWARCAWTGGVYEALDWKAVETGAVPQRAEGGFLSLVPTQLARLLGKAETERWLRSFAAVFVGGGPVGGDLLARARAARVPVVLSYGMTETAAMVVAQRTGGFWGGDDSCGEVMPQVRLRLDGEGRIWVAGESLFRGYWPETRTAGEWRTDDLGELAAGGGLRVLGRADALFISGGEKVNPAEVEMVLREVAGAVLADVVAVGVPHAEWGNETVALYPVAEQEAKWDEDAVRAEVAARLAAAKRPKRYVAVPAAEWPRNAQGKVNRAALADLARRAGRG
ncbi:MAG: AMP-binding protein [Verrucomicrobia bacterium]|nr:AMP-binding protein [Verrucomicrobiota bacterium]